jgi:GDP-L-fucose synthase
MKIFITGAGGMVGKNLVEHPHAKCHEILAPRRDELDLLDAKAVSDYIAASQPDMVIHAAGLVGGIQANMNAPVRFFSENIQMGLNVVMSARDANVKSLMNLGTSCMYPRYAQNPLREEVIATGELEPTNEGYAIAKVAITRLCDYISKEESGRYYKTVIPCNLYGRYDTFDLDKSHMIPAVIKKLDEARQNGIPAVDIWGDGLSRREFMYAGDFADFVFYALVNFDAMPQNINIGLGRDYTINEYYTKIAKITGYRGKLTHDLTKPTGMKQKLVDNTRLRQFGWQPKFSLELGLKETYDYFLERVNK